MKRAHSLSPRREQTLGAIKQAARGVLERKGYARTTLRDIIEASDVTHPTFYKYFDSKEDILGELIDGLVDELVEAGMPFGLSHTGSGSGAEPSIRGKLRLGVKAVLAVAQRNRKLLSAVREAIHANPQHARRWAHFRSRSLAVLRHDLGWAERAGLVRCEDLSVLSIAMTATMEATLFELTARDDRRLAVVENVLVEFYWNALFGWRNSPHDYVFTRGAPRPIFPSVRTDASAPEDAPSKARAR